MWVYWSSYLNNGSWTIAYYPTELDIITNRCILDFCSVTYVIGLYGNSPTDFYPFNLYIINLLNFKLQDDHVLCLVIFQAIRWWVQSDLHPIIDSNDVTGIQNLKSQNRRLFGGFKCFFFSPRFLEQWSNLTKICSRWVVQPHLEGCFCMFIGKRSHLSSI